MSAAPIIYRTSVPHASLAEYEVMPNTYVLQARPGFVDTKTRTLVGVHGSGTSGGHFIYTPADALRILQNTRGWPYHALGESLRGSITLYTWDSSVQQLAVLPDPMGAGIVYFYRSAHEFALSSDLAGLVTFLRKQGKEIARSVEYSASLIATGSGGIVSSSYDGIEALEHFQYVVFERNGLTVRDYPAKQEALRAKGDYYDALRRARDELLEITTAAIAAPHHYKISHLTGGFDSRVVLGALLALGGSDLFRYFCLKTPKVDRDIAEGLAASYGLTMTEYSGADWQVLPGSLEEQLLGPMVRSSGILPGAPDIGMTGTGSLILQGGYGELYRTFYAVDMAPAADAGGAALADQMWASRGFSTDGTPGLFTRDFKASVAGRVEQLIRDALEMGIRSDAIADYIYMRVRNRYFVGTQSREWSGIGSQIDPLYGWSALPAVYAMDFNTRRSNVFGFDLLNLLTEDLIRYPYAKRAFDWMYQDLRPVPDPLHFSASRPSFDERVAPAAKRRHGGRIPAPTDEQVAKANALRLPAGRIAQADFALPRLMTMLEGITTTIPNFAEVFEVPPLISKLSEGVQTPPDVALVLTMYSSCLWLTEADAELFGETKP